MPEPIRFKYKELNSDGQEVGFLSKKASFDGEMLVMDGVEIPIVAVLRAQRRFNRLVLVLLQQDGGTAGFAVAITSGNVDRIMTALNQRTSQTWAQYRKEALAKEGREKDYRSETCAHCRSTIDMTGKPKSPQIHCPFCDILATQTMSSRPSDETSFRLCDQCGFFAEPKGFTVFYFVFILVAYYFQWRRTYMCNSCMRGEAWKMFFGNLIFIIGFPFAVVQVVRAYFGGSTLSRSFGGLDGANNLAKKGRAKQASPLYAEIEKRLGHCAGVRFNHGMAFELAGDEKSAIQHYETALKDCSNYFPAHDALARIFQDRKMTEELAELKRNFGD